MRCRLETAPKYHSMSVGLPSGSLKVAVNSLPTMGCSVDRVTVPASSDVGDGDGDVDGVLCAERVRGGDGHGVAFGS